MSAGARSIICRASRLEAPKLKHNLIGALFFIVSSNFLHHVGEAGCCINVYLGGIRIVQNERCHQNENGSWKSKHSGSLLLLMLLTSNSRLGLFFFCELLFASTVLVVAEQKSQ